MGMKPFSSSAHVKAKAPGSALLQKAQKGKEKPNSYRQESNKSKAVSVTGNVSGNTSGNTGRVWHGGRSKFIGKLRWIGGVSVGLILFMGLGAALVHGYNLFMTSEYFAVRQIEITGDKRVDVMEALNALEIHKGKNTLAVSIAEMEAALKSNNWVAGFSVRRVLPDTLKISVTERDPEYLVNLKGVLYYADYCGAPIMPVLANDFAPLPTLEIEEGAEKFAGRLPALIKSFKEADVPLDSAAVEWIRLSAAGLLEIGVNSYLRVVLTLDEWEINLQHLKRVFVDLSRRGELRNTTEIRAQGSNVWVLKKTDI